ncbi:MAG: DUF4388 domain-containing protein [Deltaproteobacteria bacterium]|nr:DUF4388 domain-containing protein [Deltaproteobacteria bacterium]
MSENLTVFIAEHDESFASLAMGQIAARGMTVRKFRSGAELLEALEEQRIPPDVLLLAALLPDRNGLELCKKIKDYTPYSKIKIILVSSFPRTARFVSEAKTRYRADFYIEQPFEVTLIPDVVAKVAEGGAEEITTPPKTSAGAQKASAQTAAPRKSSEPAAPTPVRDTEPERRKPEQRRAIEPEFEPRRTRPVPRDMEGRRESDAAPTPRPAARRPARRMLSLPLSGNLHDVLLPELLLYLYQSRSTGVLKLKCADEERRITLRNGVPVAIDTNFIADQALGRILIEQERITTEQFDTAKRTADFQGRRIGEVLVEMGAVTSHELLATLHFQARQKLMSAFRHREGTYVVEEGTPTLRDTGQLEDSILSILLAGVKNYYTLTQLEERVYNNKRRVVAKNDTSTVRRGALQLTRKEWELLDLVNGERTLGEIISLAELSFVRTFQIVYLLFLFGFIRFVDEGPAFFQIDEPVMSRAVAEADELAVAPPDPGRSIVELEGEGEDRLMRLLYRLNGMAATGTVVVGSRRDTHRIEMRRGNPVRITSERLDHWNLGNLLVERNLITADQRDAALEESKMSGRPLGETFLKRGAIGPHQLYEALVAQVDARLQMLSEALDVEDIRFEPGADSADDAGTGVDVLRVIIAAFRSRMNREAVESDLKQHLLQTPKMAPAAQSRVRKNLIDAREAQLLSSFNGKRTLDQIIRITPIGRERVLSLVHALYQLGLLDFESEFEAVKVR